MHYRGRLPVHAAAVRRPDRTRQFGLAPDVLACSALVGVVELVDIIRLDEAAYKALRGEHRHDQPYPGEPLYAWRLARPRRFPRPIPCSGR